MAAAATQSTGHSTPTPTSPPQLTQQARNTFKSSFERFEQTVNKLSGNDHREFSSTTLQDVRQAAKEIEQQLAARQCLRNMRRLESLLDGLEAYSKAVEILANGTPYLPWIWAPIKLMMKLATDYIGSFEKLMAAYGRIAENLPRFDRLSNAYRNNPDFQLVLAVVYSDIIEFHRQAYKFFRTKGWKCFFKSSWGRFDARFGCILDSLSRHSDLVDREANAFLISNTMQWRNEAIQAATRKEKEISVAQLAATLAWLNLDSIPHCGQYHQEDILDKLISDCCPGTTEWILKHQKLKSWLKDGRAQPTLWLKGKPGSGKSTLCAKIVQFLRADKRSTILFCFYSYRISGVHPHPSVFILATLLSQVLRQNQNLSAYVYEDFVVEGHAPSTQNLKSILHNLLPQLKSPQILIDGIDECIRYDSIGKPQDLNLVKDVLQDILQLETATSTSFAPKLLVASRDILQVVAKLAKKPMVSLDEETGAVRSDIRCFANRRLLEIRDRFETLPDIHNLFRDVEDKITLNSQEMFLWARLVLLQLEEDAYSLDDLETAIINMPVGLNDFYSRIVSRIQLLNRSSQERVIGMLQWMICCRRPLRRSELQDGIAFSGETMVLNDRTKLPATIVDLCKPLVQILSDDTVVFVHSTVQEFLVNSGFTTSREAEHYVTTCCLNYIGFSFSLIDTSITDEQRTVDVGKCLYSMQAYTSEHWMDHLLAYGSESANLGLQDAQLHRRLDHLLARIRQYQAQEGTMVPSWLTEDLAPIPAVEPRLALFKRHEAVFELLTILFQHRQLTRLSFGEASGRQQITNLWNTPLSKVRAEYDTRVQLLLSSPAFPGLDPAQLALFKSVNGPFAYTCRFPGCSSPTAGFSTDEVRIQHEKTHAPPLLCTFPTCTYTLRFASIEGLKRHIRDNHTAILSSVPRSLRAVSNSSNPLRPLPQAHRTSTRAVPQSFMAATASPPHIQSSAASLSPQNLGSSHDSTSNPIIFSSIPPSLPIPNTTAIEHPNIYGKMYDTFEEAQQMKIPNDAKEFHFPDDVKNQDSVVAPFPALEERHQNSGPNATSDNHDFNMRGGWECAQCETRCYSEAAYKKHMLKHSKPYKCKVPGCRLESKGFATMNSLARHKNSNHRTIVFNVQETYQCASQYCQNRETLWIRLDNFRQHIARMHREEDEDDLIRRSVREKPASKIPEDRHDNLASQITPLPPLSQFRQSTAEQSSTTIGTGSNEDKHLGTTIPHIRRGPSLYSDTHDASPASVLDKGVNMHRLPEDDDSIGLAYAYNDTALGRDAENVHSQRLRRSRSCVSSEGSTSPSSSRKETTSQADLDRGTLHQNTQRSLKDTPLSSTLYPPDDTSALNGLTALSQVPYACNWCEVSCLSQYASAKHQVDSHSYSEQRYSSTCQFCDEKRNIGLASHYINHLEERHANLVEAVELKAHLTCFRDISRTKITPASVDIFVQYAVHGKENAKEDDSKDWFWWLSYWRTAMFLKDRYFRPEDRKLINKSAGIQALPSSFNMGTPLGDYDTDSYHDIGHSGNSSTQPLMAKYTAPLGTLKTTRWNTSGTHADILPSDTPNSEFISGEHAREPEDPSSVTAHRGLSIESEHYPQPETSSLATNGPSAVSPHQIDLHKMYGGFPCNWCYSKFTTVALCQEHEVNTHDYRDPRICPDFCQFCLGSLELPFGTDGLLYHLRKGVHIGRSEVEIVRYTGHLSCLMVISVGALKVERLDNNMKFAAGVRLSDFWSAYFRTAELLKERYFPVEHEKTHKGHEMNEYVF